MTESVTRLLSLDRDEMSDVERELFIKDLKRVIDEYFEVGGDTSLEITRGDSGFVVCLLFTAHRIKNVKSPV